ncbi:MULTISPECIES: amidohydrolase [Aerococcus]|uniref:Amidohydrolase n=1 Tax=Aerococcus sanguinicola TaxID=119206 RepID=A0A5N1GLK9_9LACT|nr:MULTISPECIES: amidohydrolase [Aerococcus]KAA9301168.1 amidohydrolase [Aerococcus sanguinicola]MDK6369302.1 amidohydrolase [Aerococcus sp. UMB9870]MDK6679126.1 amidohydrolase [Aerococcus sp. UMB8608]MDK6687189.1 amidohydrolase [Aerococcus sp. UMB8623]MDK6941145.1 amidohydrolase [Aerococcus sp. UMB8487]
MSLVDELYKRLDEKEDQMIEIRRHFHENPEVSFEEKETAQYIADFYKDLDCEVRTNVGNGYGLVVTIDTGKEGKTLALRADFDALPLTEDTGLDFSSKKEGAMHACGHDAHTAYLMVLAQTLIEMKDQLSGKFVIIHQNAEEVAPGGAKSMIEDGALDGVDNIIALHVMTNMPTGGVFYHEGNAHTGRSNFKVTLHGKGGHASSPHQANDTIVAASYFVTEIQSVVSRRLNPFDVGSITIGNFDAAGANNAIQGEVTLGGDVRAMSQEVRDIIEHEVKAKLEGIKNSFAITYDLHYENDYPVAYNDPKVTEFAVKAIKDHPFDQLTEGVDTQQPQPPSDDIAYFLQKVPGVYLWVGAAPKDGEAYPHHHPKFVMDEDAMLIAAKSVAAFIGEYVENNGVE